MCLAERIKIIRRKRKFTDAFVYSWESSDYKYAKRDKEPIFPKIHYIQTFLPGQNSKPKNISLAFKSSICLPNGPLSSKDNIFRNTAIVHPLNYVPDSESTQTVEPVVPSIHTETFGSIDPEIWEIMR